MVQQYLNSAIAQRKLEDQEIEKIMAVKVFESKNSELGLELCLHLISVSHKGFTSIHVVLLPFGFRIKYRENGRAC